MFDHLKYLSSFFLPGCVLWFLYTGPHSAISALVWTIPLWALIVLDWFSPKVNINKKKQPVSAGFYDAILYALAILQFLIIGLLLHYASQLQWSSVTEISRSIVNLAVLRILIGTTSGSSALIVAHELIHRSQRHKQILGKMLLYTVCYEHFVIAHLQGHHLSVATPEDIATAKLDENFSSYWQRVIVEHFKYAWDFELKRLCLEHTPVYHYQMLANSVFRGVIIEVTLVVLILIVFGWAAAFIFLYQALAGVRLLESINYYQHWGLEEGRADQMLAWVNQSSLSEYALVGLTNHVGHHQQAHCSFYEIPYSDQGPIMPYGYFVTNLWVKLNNASYRRVSAGILKNYLHQARI
ncbi:MAG TPA: fatty acid desaturase [Methyloprofundus sp.]|uniref:fatty acid desaturase n=1 Tax=Methyloprofundus sp. TaxID=2020875 RepID=UPI0018593FBC|nr:fatty acid desaturase [Methyloprofundus sp.]HIG64189.1 fatty acid desaturase [Methyloprofundus sp.]HIL78648.1 fatty acid desaturase [Methylococcales bacterium]